MAMNPSFRISKTFRFEAAHRLIAPYQGKCNHMHGHSYIVTVSIEKSKLDERGFVRDFSELRPLRDWIDQSLDHATLVSSEDLVLLEWLKREGQKHYVVEGNSTCERLAEILFLEAQRMNLEPASVEVAETPSSSAFYACPGC